MMHYCPLLLFYLPISPFFFFEPWHLQTAFLQSHTSHSRLRMRTSLFLFARAVEREMQEVELWRDAEFVALLPSSLCPCLTLSPDSTRSSFRSSHPSWRRSVPSGCSRLTFFSLLFFLFFFSSSSFLLSSSLFLCPPLFQPRHSDLFKQLRGICWSSCYSCWSNKDPSEW